MKAGIFGNYLRGLRKNKKLTIRQLETYSGVSNSYISQMERGQRGIPSPTVLKKLAKPLGVPYEELMDKAGHLPDQLLPYGLSSYNPGTMERLPVLGTVRAGEPILMSDSIEGYMEIETDVLRGRKGFILRVKGDSMSGDGIFDGDLAIIELKNEAEPHEIAVVSIDNEEATLKRVECLHGVCALKPSNPAYETKMYPFEQIHIHGVVVETRRRFK